MNKNNKIKKIKSICKKDFRVKTINGEVIEILTDDHTTHYDQNGNILEEKHRKWSDDQSGYTIESTSYIYNKEGKIAEMYERNGDSLHLLTDEYTYKKIYSYNDKGRLVEQVYYDMEGNPQKKYLHQYDEQKRETKQTYYEYYKSKDGEIKEYLWNTTTTTYDEESNSVETIYDRGVSMMKITTKYDENRNMIEEICECGYDRENEIYKYEYNEHGEIIMIYKEYFKNDTLLETEITKYDNGNSIEFITQEYDENGSETDNTKSVYTNDEYGNMITRAYYINGKLTSITRAEIEYYD
jgi:hypothetical protein